jgi:FAD dependent oxidoreductase
MRLFHIYPLLVASLAGTQSLAALSPLALPLRDPPDDQVHWQATFELESASDPDSLPVPNSTLSFWMHGAPGVNPLARVGSSGSLTADADICIIGSGITGVSVAYHLSKLLGSDAALQRTLNIVLLEARDFC